jgi:hypothetical protein
MSTTVFIIHKQIPFGQLDKAKKGKKQLAAPYLLRIGGNVN